MAWLIIICSILLDRISKILVISNMTETQSMPLIKGIFEIKYVLNDGIAFGLFEGNNLLITIIVALAIGGIAFYMVKDKGLTKKEKVFLSFVIGGAIGNIMDRLLYNAVIDYLYISLINFPIFNIADIFVCTGIVGLIYLIIFNKVEVKSENA